MGPGNPGSGGKILKLKQFIDEAVNESLEFEHSSSESGSKRSNVVGGAGKILQSERKTAD